VQRGEYEAHRDKKLTEARIDFEERSR